MTMDESSPDSSVPDEFDPVLAELAAELADRIRAGDPFDLESLTVQHPERAQQLRQLLPTIMMMAALKVPETTVEGDRKSVRQEVGADETPGRLGDYEIVREIGRGGMGVVYEARQVTLGRRVALKILPSGIALDPRQLQRFQLEAQVAGGLNHPHIVPIYAVGYERGTHYYVMRLIKGKCLAEVILGLRRLEGLETRVDAEPASDTIQFLSEVGLTSAQVDPIGTTSDRRSESDGIDERNGGDTADVPQVMAPPKPAGQGESSSRTSLDFIQDVTRLMLQAAKALAYAHDEGVVHRDIKPSNLMIDGEGELWITDFGLARLLGHETLTGAGDLLGTLRYMSPEQAMGQRVLVDHRTDIYSLGATLYELLTLQPAVVGIDRQEMLQQIIMEEPRRPRRFNTALSKDMETIVLKAMAKDPAERYANAHKLADDLQRFLEHRPILASRPSLWARAARWSGRHKRTVVLSLVGLLLASLGLIASNLTLRRERDLVRRHTITITQQRDQVRHQAAEALLDRGLTSCELGDAGLGLLLLARALETAPENSPSLQRIIRLNLAAWAPHVPRLRAVLPGHGRVYATAFSPEGNRALTGTYAVTMKGELHEAWLWDCNTGQRLGGMDRASRIAASTDGKTTITTGGGGKTYLKDLLSGNELGAPMPAHSWVMWGDDRSSPRSNRPAFIPDREIWDKSIGSVFSPDGERLLAKVFVEMGLNPPKSTTYRLYDSSTGRAVGPTIQIAGLTDRVVFSQDGNSILALSRVEGTWAISLWNSRTEQPLGPSFFLPSGQPKPTSLALSNQGRVLFGTEKGTAEVWNAVNRQRIGSSISHDGVVLCVKFGPDETTVMTGSNKGTIRRWYAETGRSIGRTMTLQGEVTSMAFDPDGRIALAGTGDGVSRLWEIPELVLGRKSPQSVDHRESRSIYRSPEVHVSWFDDPVSPSNMPIPAKVPPIVRENRGLPDSGFERILKAEFGPYGNTTLLTDRGRVRFKVGGGPLRDPEHQYTSEPNTAITFSPDGERFLTANGDGLGRVWNSLTGTPIGRDLHAESEIVAASFSHNSDSVFTICRTGKGQRWDLKTGTAMGPPIQDERQVEVAVFSPDGGTLLIGASDGTTKLWDLATGRCIGPPLETRSISEISRPSKSIFSSEDSKAITSGIGFSSDGQYYLTGCRDEPIRLWRTTVPLRGSIEQIKLWTQVLTGRELNEIDAVRLLDEASWKRCREQLQTQGGTPTFESN
ncbi:WD40 repeat domain-containing serine/threonine protein kinase [Singulisphaera sp. Ch08]|uniref:WD40 repeat domain-containing serine/threonine protein kinase n=1 Tax=Singulisphaera sp. Ch08 TaxID=3120278 RepID=A0AAU7CGB7_9BACT